jgi:hypothetical protein
MQVCTHLLWAECDADAAIIIVVGQLAQYSESTAPIPELRPREKHRLGAKDLQKKQGEIQQ